MDEVKKYLNILKDLTRYVIYDNKESDIKKLDKMIDKANKGNVDKLLKKKDDGDEW